MFEFSVDSKSKELKRFSLTLCNHYSIESGNIEEPEFFDGAMVIIGPDKTECDTFQVKVYDNGVLIAVSPSPATKHLKCGQLIFGLTNSDELVSLYIIGLSTSEINHIKNELKL